MKIVRKLMLSIVMATGVGVLAAHAQQADTIGEEGDTISARCWSYCSDRYDGSARMTCQHQCYYAGGPGNMPK